jgi:hypothetical protein
MAMQKKTLNTKKTAPASKSKPTMAKVDTKKPEASKVVAGMARTIF